MPGSFLRRSRWCGLLLLAILVATLGAAFARSAAAASTPALSWTATVDGRPLDDVDANQPLRLRPSHDPRVSVTVTNRTDRELSIPSVRLSGRVVGLTFYAYDTRLDILLPPHATTTRSYELDLADLRDQAVGLIPSRFALLGPERQVLDREDLPVDVAGSQSSVYGLFGTAIAGLTALLLVGLVVQVVRRTLPANRWQRAGRYLAPGLGIGLTLTFTLSATRLIVPDPANSTSLVLGCGAGAFLAGYLLGLGSPKPERAVVLPDLAGQAAPVEAEPARVPSAAPAGEPPASVPVIRYALPSARTAERSNDSQDAAAEEGTRESAT